MLYQLEQSQWWTPQALQRAQFEQLKNLLSTRRELWLSQATCH
jgi:hypothetical protein